MTKTILLGMGAQKTGTTWIYKYLEQHPECAFGQAKELATLPAHFQRLDTLPWRIKRFDGLEKACTQARDQIRNGQTSPEQVQVLLEQVEAFSAVFDLGHYLHYFDRRFANKPEAKVAGDLTPANCTLQIDDLQQVKKLFADKGYRVKVLFIMRDPVERCFSSIRMAQRRQRAAGQPITDETYAEFLTEATSEACQIRTRYEKILPRIEAVFGPEDRHVTFYETLFAEEEIKSFCDFLGISFQPTRYKKRVNKSPRNAEPSSESWSAVRSAYKETYDFCANRFGADFIGDIWGEQPL